MFGQAQLQAAVSQKTENAYRIVSFGLTFTELVEQVFPAGLA